MNRITVGKIAGYTIATVAATMSYGHQVDLLDGAKLGALFGVVPYAWVVPATVDLLAIIALMVRTDPEATSQTQNVALVPLILAGSLSVAANVATAHTKVGAVVGVWTVLAYLIAEWFVSRMERKPAPEVIETAEDITRKAVKATEQELAARKRAGYDRMDRPEKAAWTKAYRERIAKRTSAAAPTSPGMPPVGELEYAG
jgi:hypothetical protein